MFSLLTWLKVHMYFYKIDLTEASHVHFYKIECSPYQLCWLLKVLTYIYRVECSPSQLAGRRLSLSCTFTEWNIFLINLDEGFRNQFRDQVLCTEFNDQFKSVASSSILGIAMAIASPPIESDCKTIFFWYLIFEFFLDMSQSPWGNVVNFVLSMAMWWH